MSKASDLDITVKRYILSTIEEGETVQEKIDYIRDKFTAGFDWRRKQIGQEPAMIEWLLGLALDYAYTYTDILALAYEWGMLPENATEKQEQKILDNYWRFMAAKTCQLITGYRVPKE